MKPHHQWNSQDIHMYLHQKTHQARKPHGTGIFWAVVFTVTGLLIAFDPLRLVWGPV